MRSAFKLGQTVNPWILAEGGYPVEASSDSVETGHHSVVSALSPTAPLAGSRAPDEVVGTVWEPKQLADDYAIRVELDGAIFTAEQMSRQLRALRRVVINGRAGAGKTTMAVNMLQGPPAAMIAFIGRPGWVTEVGDRLLAIDFDQPRRDWRLALDILLEGATKDISGAQFENQAQAQPVVLAIDSLNSASGLLARRVLDVVDAVLRNLPNVTAVVTDRSLERYPRHGKWHVARVLDVGEDVAAAVIDRRFGADTWNCLDTASRRLLSSPFFLNLSSMGTDPRSSSRAAALRDFFSNQVMMSAEAVAVATTATVGAYRSGSRWIARANLTEGVASALLDAGVLSADPQNPANLYFSHELFGDYLASLELASAGTRWQSAELDTLSFSGERWLFDGLSADGENFDVITLAAQQMGGFIVGDRYIRAVYDWNWRAAVECLAATDPHDGPFSMPARLAVIGLLCERLGDPVDGTRQRARRLLGQLPDKISHELADVPGSAARQHLCRRLAGISSDGWFDRWAAIFARNDGAEWSPAELEVLYDADTLLGWTLSYVLKRSPLPDRVSQRLVGAYEGLMINAGQGPDLSASIRWRIVHALAAGDGPDVLRCLLAALDDDPYPWVRWGAARSVAEYAARADPPGSAAAIGSLHDRVGTFTEAIAKEIAWVSQYHGASARFPAEMRTLLGALKEVSADDSYRTQWNDWLVRFEGFWAADIS